MQDENLQQKNNDNCNQLKLYPTITILEPQQEVENKEEVDEKIQDKFISKDTKYGKYSKATLSSNTDIYTNRRIDSLSTKVITSKNTNKTIFTKGFNTLKLMFGSKQTQKDVSNNLNDDVPDVHDTKINLSPSNKESRIKIKYNETILNNNYNKNNNNYHDNSKEDISSSALPSSDAVRYSNKVINQNQIKEESLKSNIKQLKNNNLESIQGNVSNSVNSSRWKKVKNFFKSIKSLSTFPVKEIKSFKQLDSQIKDWEEKTYEKYIQKYKRPNETFQCALEDNYSINNNFRHTLNNDMFEVKLLLKIKDIILK